jgi:hypothetical protein
MWGERPGHKISWDKSPQTLHKSIEAAIELYRQGFIEKISTELLR